MCFSDSISGGFGGRNGAKTDKYGGDGAFYDHGYGFYNLYDYMYPDRWGNLGGRGVVYSGNVGGGNGNLGKGGDGGNFGGNTSNTIT